eukprot:TRINITY_DN12332_c0_g1_i1.p1 TRINITY_DN12332_c0_g1~~TRINITY_DN12332_c0_g1_i1.p1  ORF type:complete len:632 (+),score=112.50 TRINITY_DN12332_c0_g1_i1:40-1935(+)
MLDIESEVGYTDHSRGEQTSSCSLFVLVVFSFGFAIALAFAYTAIPIGPVDSIQINYWIFSFVNQQLFGILAYFSFFWICGFNIPGPTVILCLITCPLGIGCTAAFSYINHVAGWETTLWNKIYPPFTVTLPVVVAYFIWAVRIRGDYDRMSLRRLSANASLRSSVLMLRAAVSDANIRDSVSTVPTAIALLNAEPTTEVALPVPSAAAATAIEFDKEMSSKRKTVSFASASELADESPPSAVHQANKKDLLAQPLLPRSNSIGSVSSTSSASQFNPHIGFYFSAQTPDRKIEYSAAFPSGEIVDRKRMSSPLLSFQPIRLARSPLLQLVFAFAYWGVILLVYTFCEKMSTYLGQTSNDTGLTFSFVVQIFVFIVGLQIARALLKLIGYWLDMGKIGGPPMYFQAEIVVLTYYYLFHRIIFSSVTSVGEFILFESLHLLFEWFFYAVRSLQWYTDRCTTLIARLRAKNVPTLILNQLMQADVTLDEWRSFLCLDFGIRTICMLSLSVFFVTTAAFVRFGYNALHFTTSNAVLYPSDVYTQTTMYLLIAFACEIVSLILMDLLIWRRYQRSVVRRLGGLFFNRRVMLLTIALVSSITMNALVARTVQCFYMGVPYQTLPETAFCNMTFAAYE